MSQKQVIPAIFICKYCKCTFLDPVEFVAHKRAEHEEQTAQEFHRHSNKNRTLEVPSCSNVSPPPPISLNPGGPSTQIQGSPDNKEMVNDNCHNCRFCSLVLPMEELERHEKEHTGDGPYQCKHCLKGFEEESEAEVHELVCPVLDLLEAESSKFIAEQGSDGLYYGCEICGKRLKYYSELLRHQVTHSNETPFECLECNVRFKHSRSMKRHQRRLHNSSTTGICSVSRPSHFPMGIIEGMSRPPKFKPETDKFILQTSIKGVVVFKCKFCDYHRPVGTSAKEANRRRAQIRRHVKKHHTKVVCLRCSRCKLTFQTPSELGNHLFNPESTCSGLQSGDRKNNCGVSNQYSS